VVQVQAGFPKGSVYILCIDHLNDVVPEKTKECGSTNNLQCQYNTVKVHVQFTLIKPYKHYKVSQYINIHIKV